MRYRVRSATPRTALLLAQMNSEIDVCAALPALAVPTLVMHRSGDRHLPVEASRYLARQIRGAKLVEFPGGDHFPWTMDMDPILSEVEAFVTGTRPPEAPERVLATVMFADIVESTQRAAAIGDRAWKKELEAFYALTRQELERHRGREIITAGDGYLFRASPAGAAGAAIS
jgi:hypothetical protein